MLKRKTLNDQPVSTTVSVRDKLNAIFADYTTDKEKTEMEAITIQKHRPAAADMVEVPVHLAIS